MAYWKQSERNGLCIEECELSTHSLSDPLTELRTVKAAKSVATSFRSAKANVLSPSKYIDTYHASSWDSLSDVYFFARSIISDNDEYANVIQRIEDISEVDYDVNIFKPSILLLLDLAEDIRKYVLPVQRKTAGEHEKVSSHILETLKMHHRNAVIVQDVEATNGILIVNTLSNQAVTSDNETTLPSFLLICSYGSNSEADTLHYKLEF